MKKALTIIAASVGLALAIYFIAPIVIKPWVQKLFWDSLAEGPTSGASGNRSRPTPNTYPPSLESRIKIAKSVAKLVVFVIFVAVLWPWKKGDCCPSCNCGVCGRWRMLVWLLACAAIGDFVDFFFL